MPHPGWASQFSIMVCILNNSRLSKCIKNMVIQNASKLSIRPVSISPHTSTIYLPTHIKSQTFCTSSLNILVVFKSCHDLSPFTPVIFFNSITCQALYIPQNLWPFVQPSIPSSQSKPKSSLSKSLPPLLLLSPALKQTSLPKLLFAFSDVPFCSSVSAFSCEISNTFLCENCCGYYCLICWLRCSIRHGRVGMHSTDNICKNLQTHLDRGH